jgi:FKBP-type peptidyl-prolyl cis-trans isomerase
VSRPPEVSVPPGPPPKQLVIKDLKRGAGAVLQWGTKMSVRYIALKYETGNVVERHWLNPFSWGFGPGQVVRAWVIGLKGMRVGGVRELISPSRLAYKQGARIWVVELLSVSDGSA